MIMERSMEIYPKDISLKYENILRKDGKYYYYFGEKIDYLKYRQILHYQEQIEMSLNSLIYSIDNEIIRENFEIVKVIPNLTLSYVRIYWKVLNIEKKDEIVKKLLKIIKYRKIK